MTIHTTCPNPKCHHHGESFEVVIPRSVAAEIGKERSLSLAKKGGKARWSSMSPEERKAHINRMVNGRRKPKKS